MIDKKNFQRTASASLAENQLIEMNINRREIGMKTLILILGWAASNGLITEPESKIITGRAGMLKRYSSQGYLIQIKLPPGLKGAPHFSHEHYYHLTEKGMMMVSVHLPHLSDYGNIALRQRMYLHDFIGRIEAAWRLRVCQIVGYFPEVRLPDMASPNQKQHDGNYLLFGGDRIGVEVEAFDHKSGDKLARFVSHCLNSITSNRVNGLLLLVQTESARRHYSKPFFAGEEYCPEWVKQNGRWYPRKISSTIITKELSLKVDVKLILTESQVKNEVACMPTIYLPSAFDDNVLD